jgi:hypothetical protein
MRNISLKSSIATVVSLAPLASLALLALLVFMCGCETVGAMGTGRMTKEDVGYIVKAGSTGRRSPPVKVENPDVDDNYAVASRPFARWRDAWRKVGEVDPWIQENLW